MICPDLALVPEAPGLIVLQTVTRTKPATASVREAGDVQLADVAIVGAGLAGSAAAAMLARAGVDFVLVDPNPTYPKDFRAEKFERNQVELLRRMGLADEVLPTATPISELWIARFGWFVQRRVNRQYGYAYETLVNKFRELSPAQRFLQAKVTAIVPSDGRQTVTLSDGRILSARLVVLATGPSFGLRSSLGIERKIISPCHSVTLGFDLTPADGAKFAFRALTYYPERLHEPLSCLSLFPIGDAMRANLFAYRGANDPWYAKFREDPGAACLATMPGLKRLLGDFKITGEIRVRPVDLYETSGHLQAGIVLIGDAFSSSCPATGTGVSKAFTDVLRLCSVHIPRWLKTDGMGGAKIAAFYADADKRSIDASARAQALRIRSLAVGPNLRWPARRMVKFIAGNPLLLWNAKQDAKRVLHARSA